MKYYSAYQHPKNLYFIIEYVQDIGYYSYVYSFSDSFKEDLKTLNCPHHEEDFLQDTLDISKEELFEEYGVPIDSWVEVPPEK